MRLSIVVVVGVVLTGCAQTQDRTDAAVRSDLAERDLFTPSDLLPPSDLTIVDLIPPLAPNGTSCDAAAACASGFCVDGVCCDKACDGLCESCILSGTVGECTPIPSGEDPNTECRGMPLLIVDGGLGDGGDFSSVDGGSFVNFAACAGACNGKRMCSYPAADKACGAPYCSEDNQAAKFQCDGKGGCLVDKHSCQGTYCKDGACPTQCAGPADCQPGWYCNGLTSQCAPVKANGLQCTLAYECGSGFCEGGVCCNQACGAPGSCGDPGFEGTCRCGGKSCGLGVACKLFYQDLDEDSFGDQFGTVDTFTARAACVGDPAPSGFVDDHTDCDDGDARANPNATEFRDAPSLGRGIYDYDCNGTVAKETREHMSGTCVFCSGAIDACTSSSTCSTAGQGAVLTCEAGLSFCSCGSFLCLCSRCGGGIFSSPSAGFVGAVDCGDTGHYRACGTCASVNGGVTGTTDDYSKVQRCR